MAQTGYTPISFYYSSTSSNIPSAGNLVDGEIAINTADGVIYYKNSGGSVVPLQFGSTGISWQSVQTANFTATAGNGYPVNTTSGQITVLLPATPAAGDLVTFTDYAGTFATNNLIIDPNGNKLLASTDSVKLETNNESLSFVYIDATQGWLPYDGFNSSIPATALYLIQNSLRLRNSNSAYLSRTAVSPTLATKFTVSFWTKIGSIFNTRRGLITSVDNTGFSYWGIEFGSTNNLTVYDFNSAGAITTNAAYVDPAAWYHVVVAVDTTQATASNRVLMYVNGAQITSFSAANYPPQNSIPYIQVAGHAQGIGSWTPTIPWYYDGYMAEVNFIDGQALTPSSFGKISTATGSWIPIQYTGTYGTNGFYLPFTSNRNSSYAGSFNGSSQYLGVNPAPSLSFGTNDYTIETWLNTQGSGSNQVLYDGRYGITFAGTVVQIFVDPSGFVYVYGGAGTATLLITSAKSIPLNAWTHIAVSRQSGTTKLFINGVQSGSSVVDNTNYNAGGGAVIGAIFGGLSFFVNGKMSNFRIVNGTAVYTSNFTPSTTPLTAITNTVLLTLQNSSIVDNSTNAFSITNSGGVTTSVQYPLNVLVYNDQSGNGNNWTPNNLSQFNGSTYDPMTDVPTLTNATTANYATLNPLNIGSDNVTLSNGNLSFTSSATTVACRVLSTIAVSSGKWYCEYVATSASTLSNVGIAIATESPNVDYLGGTSGSYGYYSANGNKYNNGSSSAYGASWVQGDIIGIAFDADVGTLTFYKNGVSQGTAFSSIPAGAYYFGQGDYSSTFSGAFNFGQQPFQYSVPSGYLPLNTFNL